MTEEELSAIAARTLRGAVSNITSQDRVALLHWAINLREQNTKLLEVKRVASWAELLMREVAPEIAAEMRKAIEGAK